LSSHEELLADIKAVLQGKGKDADSRADAIASSNPVPEPKSIIRVDSKLLQSNKVSIQ
jgi:hypothetical protein